MISIESNFKNPQKSFLSYKSKPKEIEHNIKYKISKIKSKTWFGMLLGEYLVKKYYQLKEKL